MSISVRQQIFLSNSTTNRDALLHSLSSINASRLEKLKNTTKHNKHTFYISRKDVIIAFTSLLIFSLVFIVSNVSIHQIQSFISNFKGETVLAQSDSAFNLKNVNKGFNDWSLAQTSLILAENGDFDSDGLTNKEEFLLQTKPNNMYSCATNTSDSENLVNLIDPATCKPINIDDSLEYTKFNQVVNLEGIRKNLLEKNNFKKPDLETSKREDIRGVFAINNYKDLDTLTTDKLKEKVKSLQDDLQKQISDLELIEKIRIYISKNRSFDQIDRNYEPPIHPAKYLDVSRSYDVPLKYVLALAQSESRFGTDRFNADGSENRIGEYKNIYAIGLTETSSSGYSTWEDGADAFGKWYKNYHSIGTSDCQKWRIYNPNGDYCNKIEKKANKISIFLDTQSE